MSRLTRLNTSLSNPANKMGTYLADNLSNALAGNPSGDSWYVDTAKAQSGVGNSWDSAFKTVAEAVLAASANDVIFVAPGAYAENVVIPVTKPNLTVIGAGGRGSTFIQALTNGVALTVHSKDVTAVNIGCEGDGTGGGAHILGRRFRGIDCKFEGGADALKVGPASVAAQNATNDNDASDNIYVRCEIAWSTDGVVLMASDYGAVTQPRFYDCWSHDLTNHITEELQAGATASIMFRDLEVHAHRFLRAEDGSAATAYVELNASNTNTGLFSDSVIAHATMASAVLQIGNGVLWVGNKTEAGVGGRPA